MHNNVFDLQKFLLREFEIRQTQNPNYTKSDFAADLGVNKTKLKKFMSGQDLLGLSNMNRVIKNLGRNIAIPCSWCGLAKEKTQKTPIGEESPWLCTKCIKDPEVNFVKNLFVA